MSEQAQPGPSEGPPAGSDVVVLTRSPGFWVIMRYAALFGVVLAFVGLAYLGLIKGGTDLWFTLPKNPGWFDGSLWWVAVTAGAGVLVGVLRRAFHLPVKMPGVVEELRAQHVEPSSVPGAVAVSLVSLAGGASLGPEAGLGMMGGGLGTWLSERRKLSEDVAATNTLSGMSAAYGGFFSDAMVAVFRAISEADPAHYVRGQYDGYLDIDGVAADSSTETYAALRLEIDNWRWSGVPFFIRTGKCLPVTQTELRLVFKHAPRLGFVALERRPEPNQLVIKLDPSTGVRMMLDARRADAALAAPIMFDVEFAEMGGEGATPYEVLLQAAISGDSVRFTRQDQVEETWRIMQPLLDAPPPVNAYKPGSWGPEAAAALVADHGGWRDPWVAS